MNEKLYCLIAILSYFLYLIFVLKFFSSKNLFVKKTIEEEILYEKKRIIGTLLLLVIGLLGLLSTPNIKVPAVIITIISLIYVMRQLDELKEVEEKKGRNFLEVQKDFKFSPDRQDAMQLYDYIDMHAEEFDRWIGKFLRYKKKLTDSGNEIVRVRIIEILEEKRRISVQAGEVVKEVDASLFFNYGKTFNH